MVDRQGWPIAWEVMPGNRADGKAFQELIGILRRRFQIGRVIMVADRGMVSEKNLELLTGDSENPFDFIVGCRMRKQKEVTEEVLSRGGRYHEVSPKLKVKEVEVKGRRYVFCLNEEEAKKDKVARELMVKAISRENRKIHHSWISRVIGGLTVLTPSGEEKALKFFFPSQKQVNKFFIKDLLDREREDIVSNRIERPYTDEQIRDILPSSLSSWSVAQCRKEMGIPPAKRRPSGYKYPPLTANFSMLYILTVEAVQSNAPATPGIYEFRLKGKEIEYPNGKTPIIYIGSARNIIFSVHYRKGSLCQ